MNDTTTDTTDTTSQPASQPVANVPAVTDIPPDPNGSAGDSEVTGSPPNLASMSMADQSIHMSGDALANVYVGQAKASKYKTQPLGDMMPVHLYRATSAMAQPPMAMLRWVVDSWLARTLSAHGANNLLLDHQWWINAPAHLRYEAALELARVEDEWRPYALATWSIMAAGTKTKGTPDITARLNPYDVVLNPENAPFIDKMHDDAVCALRYDYDPSPYQMYGRGVHAPAKDPVDDWVWSKRTPAGSPDTDCGACLLDAVKAGLRLYRGPGARKAGQEHEDMLRPTSYAFDPAAYLVDQNLQVATPEGIVRQQTDDTTLYLDTTPAWQALFGSEVYGSYVLTLMQPPADENHVATYTDEYHEQVTRALRRLPRWSMLWGDSGVTDGSSEHPLNHWELDADPKPLGVAAAGIAQTLQAIGLFGPIMPASDLIDGVAVAPSQVSRVDPLLVRRADVESPAEAYARTRAACAQELADLTATLGKTKNPMPAHASVLKALASDDTYAKWYAAQVDPAHRADVADVMGEIEFKLMVLRQVQLRQAQQAIDNNIALTLRGLANQTGPAGMLDALDNYLWQVVGGLTNSPT